MALTLAERERRYKLIREEMVKEDLDVLVVIGRRNYCGNYRYLANHGNFLLEQYVVFPREKAEPVFFLNANFPGMRRKGKGWLNDVRLQSDPQKLVVEEVRRLKGSGAIGLVEMNTIPIPIYLDLIKDFGTGAVHDATGIFRRARDIKSEEEIECHRKAAKVADDVYLYLKSIVRPGLTDWEVFGHVRRLIHEGHCEYSFDIIDCNGRNELYYPVGSVVAEGGGVNIEITPAYDGYYTQLYVDIPVSPRTVSQRKLFNAWEKGYRAAVEALRPGSRACDVYQAAVNELQSEGCETSGRAGHALGLDVARFLQLTPDDETVIEPGMVVVIHPRAQQKDGYFVMMGATFIVTKDGPEALSKVSLI
jgi:Xaa-Pro aminopeptidase